MWLKGCIGEPRDKDQSLCSNSEFRVQSLEDSPAVMRVCASSRDGARSQRFLNARTAGLTSMERRRGRFVSTRFSAIASIACDKMRSSHNCIQNRYGYPQCWLGGLVGGVHLFHFFGGLGPSRFLSSRSRRTRFPLPFESQGVGCVMRSSI